jgi:UDP-N-acetylmuramyl pentapeptide phosphotransferase/UDP-N-acetylglucosamine-1-phosphate transferase
MVQLSTIQFIASLFGIALLCFLFNQLVFLWYKKNHFYDKITIRSSHNQLATRSGGVAMFFTLTVVTFVLYAFDFQIFDFSLLLPISIIAFIGLYDDLYSMDFKFKFLFTFILAKLLIDQGLVLDSFYLFDGLYKPNYFLAQIITGITLVGVINSINLIDGVDGLASGYTLVILCVLNLLVQNYELFYLNSFLIAMLFPQIIINYNKKTKIFLGDTGSLLLGTLIAINFFTLIQPQTVFNFGIDPNKILTSWILLFFPLTDLLRVFIYRIQQNVSPFKADRKHLHHLLINKGFSHFKTTCIILLFVILNSVLGFLFWVQFDELGLLGYLIISSILYVFNINRWFTYNL